MTDLERYRALANSLKAGSAEHGELVTLGVRNPKRAVRAFDVALAHEDLSGAADQWLVPLLQAGRPAFGAELLVELADEVRKTAARPLAPNYWEPLTRVLGNSTFLARLLLQNPDWVDDIDQEQPDRMPVPGPLQSAAEIRRYKYRGLLRVAARDLSGRPFREGLDELSELADRSLTSAFECIEAELSMSGPALFALGKLGGSELNFSSDVDLLFLYAGDSGDEGEADESRRKQEVETFARAFKRLLEERTPSGFGYRVDYDLRPGGKPAPLAISDTSALDYYWGQGRPWERQMLVRLRGLCGSQEVLNHFVSGIEPYVYQRDINPDTLASVREMKGRIERERRASGVDLSLALKEGRGGIRDVEFLVQALQLFIGGREPELRTGNVLEALGGLETARALSAPAVSDLASSYEWLRRAEHALQLDEERQLHRLPADENAQLKLARRMGYHEFSGKDARRRMLSDLSESQAAVSRHFDALVLREASESTSTSSTAQGFDLGHALANSPLGERFRAHVEPLMATDAALLRSLDCDEPTALGLARCIATHPEFGRYLSLRPELLEDVTAAGRSLSDQLERINARVPVLGDDLEDFLNELRFMRRDAGLIAACKVLSGEVEVPEAAEFLSGVAESVLRASLLAAREQVPGGQDHMFCVLAMGKLAGRELTFYSDLDLIFLYEGDAAAIDSASRVAQKLIHYISTPTAVGTAYAIDARLRPSGRQGTLVTRFDSFENYQAEQAQTWEHLALMRCRAVAGDTEYGQTVLARVQRLVRDQSDSPWPEIRRLRERIAEERAGADAHGLTLKTGAGGTMDVDFLAAGGQLELSPDGPVPPAVPEMLRSLLNSAGIEGVLEAYSLLRALEARSRLVAGRATEAVDADPQLLLVVAELLEPGLAPSRLLERTSEARRVILTAVEAVLDAGSIQILDRL